MSEEGVNVIDGRNSSTVESRSSSPNNKTAITPKKFQNGWSKEQEELLAQWSDISSCYRYMHDRSEKIFKTKALLINSSVIVISSIAGFANIGVQSLFENNEEALKYSSFAIGGVSLLAGMLTTLNNLLKWSQLEEGNRVASIAWGKFQRLIAVELALKPDDRMDSMDFLKICRAELDRLIEQSPPIPKGVIKEFEAKFGSIKDIKKPDICGSIEHTSVYNSSEVRLKKLATEAALMLKKKKETLKELVTPEMEQRIAKQVNERLEAAIEERKKRLEVELEERRKYESEEEMLKAKLMEERKQKLEKELEIEKAKLEEELRVERQKVQEQEDALKSLAEERKRKIQEEIELEKKKLTQSSDISDATGLSVNKMSGSSFENRLNINRSHRPKSLRRKSVITEHIYALETGTDGHQNVIMVGDGTPKTKNTVVIPQQQIPSKQPESEPLQDDSIIIINKE
jgi:hypothetical protein